MAKAEWGTKRTCQNCGARFYDLHRSPIVCPICATVFDPERQPKRTRGAASRPEPEMAVAAVAQAAPELEEAEEFADVEDSDDVAEGDGIDEIESEDDDVIEDTSELGEDDDDIGEVIEHIDDDVADKS